MVMNFLQLSYFKALAKTENLSQTAEQLFITPPALRASISRLEREIGAPLFEKVGNRIYLNENGRILLEHTDNIFAEMDTALREIKSNAKKDTAGLSIASTSDSAWMELIAAFSSAHPEIVITKTVLRLNEIHPREIREKFDFLITSPDDISYHELEHEVLYDDDRPVLMVYPEHPLAGREGVSLAELKNEWFIALTTDFSFRKYFDILFEKAGFAPQIRVECDYMLRTRMVEEQFGVALSSGRSCRQISSRRVCFVPVTDPVYLRAQALFWHPMRKKTAAAEIFHSFVTSYFRERSGEL